MIEFTGKEAHLVASDWFETKGQALVAKALRSAPWAHAVGEDQYGAFADLCVGEAKQRFRFISDCLEPFWMADTPCTQRFWFEVMGSNPSFFRDNPDHPVETVGPDDIDVFLQHLRDYNCTPRLPNSLEWELSCSDDTEPENINLSGRAWYNFNSRGSTHPVGLKEPNRRGLYDMLGNVREWVFHRRSLWSDEYVAYGGCYHSSRFELNRADPWSTVVDDNTGFRFIIEGGVYPTLR